MRCLIRLLTCMFAGYLSSCSNFGSTQLGPDRISYNNAMQYSDLQQTLLNIVRLRYTDSPYFLELNNVVSQFSLSKTLSLNVLNGTTPGLIGTADSSLSLSESPTLTYTPLQGPDAVKRLMTPFDLGMVYYLMRSGWTVDKVIRLTLVRLGPYENAELASRQAASRVPVYKEFQELGLALRAIEHAGNLKVKSLQMNGGTVIKLIVKFTPSFSAGQRKVLARIGITPKTPFVFLENEPTKLEHHYYAQTRTSMELLNYLSKGVDVPVEHFKSGRVRRTIDKNNNEFDWHKITKGQMRVRYSPHRPVDAFVSVHYRDRWFYIADNAIYTKETLMMLGFLMSAVQGEVKSVLPVFTVS